MIDTPAQAVSTGELTEATTYDLGDMLTLFKTSGFSRKLPRQLVSDTIVLRPIEISATTEFVCADYACDAYIKFSPLAAIDVEVTGHLPAGRKITLAAEDSDGIVTVTYDTNKELVLYPGAEPHTLISQGDKWLLDRPVWDIIIDSNSKLDRWISLSAVGFHSVLVATGDWETPYEFGDLASTQTRVIHGEKGSTIKLARQNWGYGFGSTNPTWCRISGITLKLDNPYNLGDPSGFYGINDLQDCHVVFEGSATATDTGFDECDGSIACSVSNTTADYVQGFRNCEFCLGDSVDFTGAVYARGFYGCSAVNTSRANIQSTTTTIGFDACTQLLASKATTSGPSSRGFSECTGISLCASTATGTGTPWPYYNCHGFDFNCSGASNNKENIHRKYIQMNTPATAAGFNTVAHGLDNTKITSVGGSFIDSSNQRIPFFYLLVGGERSALIVAFCDTTLLRLGSGNTIDPACLNRPAFITIEYYE